MFSYNCNDQCCKWSSYKCSGFKKALKELFKSLADSLICLCQELDEEIDHLNLRMTVDTVAAKLSATTSVGQVTFK